MRIWLIFVLALLLLLKVAPSNSTTWCSSYSEVTARIWKVFRETQEIWMLGEKGYVYELFVNRETYTWTWIFVYPSTRETCVIAHGSSFTQKGLEI